VAAALCISGQYAVVHVWFRNVGSALADSADVVDDKKTKRRPSPSKQQRPSIIVVGGAKGGVDWRHRSTGWAVRVQDGRGQEDDFSCTSYHHHNYHHRPDEETTTSDTTKKNDDVQPVWQPCRSFDLALLEPPPYWAMKFMLFYPYAILPSDDTADANEEGPMSSDDELVCNYRTRTKAAQKRTRESEKASETKAVDRIVHKM
jgi:hypothetical protein